MNGRAPDLPPCPPARHPASMHRAGQRSNRRTMRPRRATRRPAGVPVHPQAPAPLPERIRQLERGARRGLDPALAPRTATAWTRTAFELATRTADAGVILPLRLGPPGSRCQGAARLRVGPAGETARIPQCGTVRRRENAAPEDARVRAAAALVAAPPGLPRSRGPAAVPSGCVRRCRRAVDPPGTHAVGLDGREPGVESPRALEVKLGRRGTSDDERGGGHGRAIARLRACSRPAAGAAK